MSTANPCRSCCETLKMTCAHQNEMDSRRSPQCAFPHNSDDALTPAPVVGPWPHQSSCVTRRFPWHRSDDCSSPRYLLHLRECRLFVCNIEAVFAPRFWWGIHLRRSKRYTCYLARRTTAYTNDLVTWLGITFAVPNLLVDSPPAFTRNLLISELAPAKSSS